MSIQENVEKILREVGDKAEVEAAAKTRTAEEIDSAIAAGIKIIGENYTSDLRKVFTQVRNKAEWHFIGSTKTQKHDLLKKKYLEMLDMIETIEDFEFAKELDRRCRELGKVMPILIEINSAKEEQKSGTYPEEAIGLVRKIARLNNIRVSGLMTMGPVVSSPEEIRPYFRLTKRLFDDIYGNV